MMNSVNSSDSLIEEMLSHMEPPIPIADRHSESKISKFYANRSIFITGATGFIGKALVEKLVRSCRDIKRIYLLVREKRGVGVQERLNDLIRSQYFDRIRELQDGSNKLLEEKLFAIEGDITLPKFGIGPEDMRLLSKECSIVFNSAATVRFSEPLDNAVRNNVYSVGQLVEFCNELEHLEALIHISTAYSNCHKRDTIYEVFYEPPMGGDQIQSAVEKLLDIQRQVHVYPEDFEKSNNDSDVSNNNDGNVMSQWSSELPIMRSACEQQKFYQDELNLPASLAHQANDSNSRQANTGNGMLTTSASSTSLMLNKEIRLKPELGPTSKSQARAKSKSNYDLLGEFTRIALRMSNKPNTYTFTKAISENYLLDKVRSRPDRYLNGKVPVAIVRPSIVSGAWREPVVGMVDNYNGATGSILSLYTGALQAMPGLGCNIADMVPVDMVTNMVVCAGWFLAADDDEADDNQRESEPKKITASLNGRKIKQDHGIYLFNFVSGSRNPLAWQKVTELIAELSYKYPTKYLLRLPGSYFIRAGKFYDLYDLLNHKIPAHLIDFIRSKLLGKPCDRRSSAVVGYLRIREMTKTLTPFTSNQWRQNDSNVKCLFECLDKVDQQVFHFDVASINWLKYVTSYIIGSRIYTMRDEAKNVPAAKRQLEMRKQVNFLLRSVMIFLIYYIFIRNGPIEAYLLSWL